MHQCRHRKYLAGSAAGGRSDQRHLRALLQGCTLSARPVGAGEVMLHARADVQRSLNGFDSPRSFCSLMLCANSRTKARCREMSCALFVDGLSFAILFHHQYSHRTFISPSCSTSLQVPRHSRSDDMHWIGESQGESVVNVWSAILVGFERGSLVQPSSTSRMAPVQA